MLRVASLQRTFKSTGVAFVVLLCLAVVPSVHAAGPVDGRVTAFYWDNDFEVDGTGLNENDAADFGLDANLWVIERLGFSAAYLNSDVGDLGVGANSAEYISLDVKFRFVSPTQNNYFALGIGWEEADLDLGPAFGDTSGPRVLTESRFGARAASGYIRMVYMPEMDDIDASVGPDLEDVEATEWEAGVDLRITSFVHLRLAYHEIEIDMTIAGGGGDLTSKSDGFIFGLGVHF